MIGDQLVELLHAEPPRLCCHGVMQRITYDETVDASYLALREIQAGEAVEQVVVERDGGEVILDFSAAGELLGVEVLGAHRILPSTILAQATRL